jgi:hypothetical protein
MIGAIIGDLAAWTWENAHNEFYPKLISSEAKVSTFGDFMLNVSSQLINDPNTEGEKWKEKYDDQFTLEDVVLCSIIVGWLYDSEKETTHAVNAYALPHGKEELYACHYIAKLIYALRHGATKNDAAQVKVVLTFRSLTKDKKWQNDDSLLGDLIRAWMAFYDAFDYGSAIHNAMKLPGNRHFNAILVGALADAMYGCGYYFIKKKYGEGSSIEKPSYIPSEMIRVYHQNRTFFPKNEAMTNVELHHWHNVDNPLADMSVPEELKQHIEKAFYTDWDNRYGFYLDDGWEYIYRSMFLLNRFRLRKQHDGTYRIVDFQSSGEKSDLSNTALKEAVYSVKYHWDQLHG